MNFDKLFEEFIDEIQGEGTYASSDEVRIATKEMLDVIKNNKDATPDELVEIEHLPLASKSSFKLHSMRSPFWSLVGRAHCTELMPRVVN